MKFEGLTLDCKCNSKRAASNSEKLGGSARQVLMLARGELCEEMLVKNFSPQCSAAVVRR